MTTAGARAQRYSPVTLRAASWTVYALLRARRLLRKDGLHARLPRPPALPVDATRGVVAVLRRTRPTCLESAVVLQTWLAAHDRYVDVVIGVRSTGGAVAAHAWIDDERSADAADYREIARIPASTIFGTSDAGPPAAAPDVVDDEMEKA